MNEKKPKSLFDDFPSLELGRMIQNIDRFDTDVPKDEKKKAEEVIKISEEVTEKIIEENM